MSAADVAAIGITNQRETTLVWDRRSGEPLCNAIVWQDRRTAGLCDKLKAQGLEALFTGRTGLLLDAYFSGTKLRWLLDQVSGARARAEAGELCFGTVDSWLIWKLTGGRVHATDATNASRTLLFNIHNCDWDDKLLGLLRVPHSMLPAVVASCGIVAETAPGAFRRARSRLRVWRGTSKRPCSASAASSPGMVKNTYGTGCFMLMQTGERPVDSHKGLLTTVAWKLGERVEYALEGSVFIAGAAIQWLRDGLGIIKSSSEVQAAGCAGPRQRRRVSGPRLRRPRRSALGSVRAGHDPGVDARFIGRPSGTRHARIDSVSDRRHPGCDADRFRHRVSKSCA